MKTVSATEVEIELRSDSKISAYRMESLPAPKRCRLLMIRYGVSKERGIAEIIS